MVSFCTKVKLCMAGGVGCGFVCSQIDWDSKIVKGIFNFLMVLFSMISTVMLSFSLSTRKTRAVIIIIFQSMKLLQQGVFGTMRYRKMVRKGKSDQKIIKIMNQFYGSISDSLFDIIQGFGKAMDMGSGGSSINAAVVIAIGTWVGFAEQVIGGVVDMFECKCLDTCTQPCAACLPPCPCSCDDGLGACCMCCPDGCQQKAKKAHKLYNVFMGFFSQMLGVIVALTTFGGGLQIFQFCAAGFVTLFGSWLSYKIVNAKEEMAPTKAVSKLQSLKFWK